MNDRKHPTPADRVRHFLASVEDYEALSSAMPIGRAIGAFGHMNGLVRWQVLTHAMLLRKYFAPDRLNLREVVKAAQSCAVGEPRTDEEWAALEVSVGPPPSSSLSIFDDDPRVFHDEDLLEALLYGRYLHGDYGKWQTSELTGARSDTAVFRAVIDRADVLLGVARWLRQGREEGALVF